MSRRILRTYTGVRLAMLLVSAGESGIDAPTTGAITVSVATSGEGTDGDGYTVVLDETGDIIPVLNQETVTRGVGPGRLESPERVPCLLELLFSGA